MGFPHQQDKLAKEPEQPLHLFPLHQENLGTLYLTVPILPMLHMLLLWLPYVYQAAIPLQAPPHYLDLP